MNQVLRALLDAARLAFNSPTANLAVTAFVGSVILLALLIVLLVFILLLTPRQRRVVKVRRYRAPRARLTSAQPFRTLLEPESEAEEVVGLEGEAQPAPAEPEGPEPQAGARRTRRVVIGAGAYGITAAVLVVVALVSGYVVSGSDQYCASVCHGTVAKAVGAHRAGGCGSCHEQPGAAGIVPNVASRARMLFARVAGAPMPSSAVVESRDCLRCHAAVLGHTVRSARGVLMSHDEPYRQGITCTECHPSTGHSLRRSYSMSSCVTCHGTQTRLSECSTCHTTDPYSSPRPASGESSGTLGSGLVGYPVVSVDRPGCEGCHDLPKTCDPCHGTRMPHTLAFIKGLHAREAAFGKKVKCQKCHSEIDCSQCHGTFSTAHGPKWFITHRTMGWNSNCVCHAARSGRTTPMCLLCHDRRR